MKSIIARSGKQRILPSVGLTLCVLGFAGLAFAGQGQEASIIGQVTDESGAVLPELSRTVMAETAPVANFLLDVYKQDRKPKYLDAARKRRKRKSDMRAGEILCEVRTNAGTQSGSGLHDESNQNVDVSLHRVPDCPVACRNDDLEQVGAYRYMSWYP